MAKIKLNSKHLVVIALGIIIIVTSVGLAQSNFDDQPKKVTITPKTNYDDSYSFSDDPIGNLQRWCEENKGVWDNDQTFCGFEHHKDALKANVVLEDLQKQKISGEHAEDICEILGISCPENPEFEGYVDLYDNYVRYNFVDKKLDYNFRIINDKLEYKGERFIGEEFYSTEGQYVKWPIDENERRKDIYSRTYPIDSDLLGNYEKWCNENNGKFVKVHNDYSNFGCTFTLKSEMTEAREKLVDLREKEIDGELAQKLCRAYGKECPSGIFITMEYDMETGILYKEKKTKDPSFEYYKITEYRIIDGVIQYRNANYDSLPWVTFED